MKLYLILKKGVNNMTVYEELVERGLIAQVTDEDELKELINKNNLQQQSN